MQTVSQGQMQCVSRDGAWHLRCVCVCVCVSVCVNVCVVVCADCESGADAVRFPGWCVAPAGCVCVCLCV